MSEAMEDMDMATNADASGVVTFEGTTVELEAWLRSFMDYQRTYVRRTAEEGKGDELAELFDRSVWRMEITPLDTVSKNRARAQFASKVSMIDAERELSELVGGLSRPKEGNDAQ